MGFTEAIIEKQLKLAEEAKVIVQAITDFEKRYPKKFRQSPYFQFGKYYRDEKMAITIKAFFQFDTWSKTYTVEMPGNDGRMVFCTEILGGVEEDSKSRVGSVFIAEDSDGGLMAIRELVKELDLAKAKAEKEKEKAEETAET